MKKKSPTKKQKENRDYSKLTPDQKCMTGAISMYKLLIEMQEEQRKIATKFIKYLAAKFGVTENGKGHKTDEGSS
jgi:hypothetical protein